MDKYYYSEKLNDYLLDKLSESEKIVFEQLLDKDPVLKQDCELQREIVEGINQFRKDQLKARLNRIDVSDTSSFHVPQWLKVSGVAASILIGAFAVYLYAPTDFSANADKSLSSNDGKRVSEQRTVEPSKKILEDTATKTLKGEEENSDLIKSQETEVFGQENTANAGIKGSEKISLNASKGVKTQNTQTTFTAETKDNTTQRKKAVIAIPAGYQKVDLTKNNLKFSKIETILQAKKQSTASNWLAKEVEEVKGVFDGSEETSLEDIAIRNKLSYQHYDEEIFFYNHYDDDAKVIQVEINGTQRQYFYHDASFYEIIPQRVERTEAIKVRDSRIISKLEEALNQQ